MINWHSENFKKVAIWIMAGLLVLFLVGSYGIRELFLGGGGKGEGGGVVEVKVMGATVDLNDYRSFISRWGRSLEGESVHWKNVNFWRMRYMGQEITSELVDAAGYADYFHREFSYIPIKPFVHTDDHRVTSSRLDKTLAAYMDNFYCRYKEAEKLGIRISDKRIDNAVQTGFRFQTQDPMTDRWSYNEQEYAQWLRGARLTEEEYRRFLREKMMIEQMERMYLGLNFIGNTPVSPIEMAAEYTRDNEQRRVKYVRETLYSQMTKAHKAAKEEMEDREASTDEEERKQLEVELKTFYENEDNFDGYATPRRIRGDCLYVDTAKLTEETGIKRSEIEKEIREQVEKENLQPSHYEDFWEKHKDRLYRRPPVSVPPPVEPPAEPREPATPTPGDAGDDEGPKEETDYIPYQEIKDRVKEDLIQHRIEEALKKRIDEEINKRLDNLYSELEEHMKAFNRVDTRAVARSVFRDVSMGNFLEKVAAFLKASMAEARRREGAADLKAFADGYDFVHYIPAGEFFSGEEAKDLPRIGGKDLAELPEERYAGPGDLRFSRPADEPREEAPVYKGGLSGFLRPDESDDRFVFRLLDVQERELADYEKLAQTNPALKKRVRDDSINVDARRRAYELLYEHQKFLISQKENIEKYPDVPGFNFEFEARDHFKAKKAYLESLGDKENGDETAEEDEDYGIRKTEYFNRHALEIEGIEEHDVEEFRDAAFKLCTDGREPALTHVLAETAPEIVDEDTAFFYLIMLVDEEEKPIRRPSRERFRGELRRLVPRAMAGMPDREELDYWSALETKMLYDFRTTRHIENQLQKRFDAVAAKFSKKIEKPKKGERR